MVKLIINIIIGLIKKKEYNLQIKFDIYNLISEIYKAII